MPTAPAVLRNLPLLRPLLLPHQAYSIVLVRQREVAVLHLLQQVLQKQAIPATLVLLSHRFLWTLQAALITLFGELDGGVTIEKLRGKDTTVKMSSGNRYRTSWGIKGVEDLGGGNAAIFTLQQASRLTMVKELEAVPSITKHS